MAPGRLTGPRLELLNTIAGSTDSSNRVSRLTFQSEALNSRELLNDKHGRERPSADYRSFSPAILKGSVSDK